MNQDALKDADIAIVIFAFLFPVLLILFWFFLKISDFYSGIFSFLISVFVSLDYYLYVKN